MTVKAGASRGRLKLAHSGEAGYRAPVARKSGIAGQSEMPTSVYPIC